MRKASFFSTAIFVSLLICMVGCDDNTADLHSNTADVWSVEIVATPHMPFYGVGDTVRLRYVVKDRQGRELGNIGANWDNPPAHQVQNLGNQEFKFLQEGQFTWSVTLESPYLLRASATLEVKNGPASVRITVDPEKDVYGIGDLVTLGYQVRDHQGQEVTGVEVSWENPSHYEVAFEGNQSFRFIQDGLFTWSVQVIGHPQLTDSLTLRVDASAPVVIIDYPERGDTILHSGGNPRVTVSGRVNDGLGGVENLTIRTNTMPTTPISLTEGDTFSISTPAVQGLNVVVIEATDYEGNKSSITRAYHYSSDFFAFSGDSHERYLLADLQNVLISDEALDRGRPSDNPPYDPCRFNALGQYACDEIRDLATLHELALNNLDFSELNPGREFNYPLFDEAWQFNIGDVEVKAVIEGDFDLNFTTSQLEVGVAKVDQMYSYDGGIHSEVSYYPTRGENGVETPGLQVALGMTGALSFHVWLDLYDPDLQLLLCVAAWNICNNDPPYDCLGDYLLSCSSHPIPLASAVSSIETPLLAKLASQSMQVRADLAIGLNQDTREAEVNMSSFNFNFAPASMDLGALEDLTINIGTIQIAGRVINLGSYNFPTTFLSDIAEDMLEPLMNTFTPLVSALISESFTCDDRESPVCFLVPFMKDMLNGFEIQTDLDVRNPFDRASVEPMAVTRLATQKTELAFRAGQGGQMTLSGRIDAERARSIDSHMDDDMLGIALSDGCMTSTPGFTGHDLGNRVVQLAPAFDLINMGLYAIWYNGGLDLNLGTGAFDLPAGQNVQDLVVQARMWLPPMLTACNSQNEAVVAELGDMHLAISMRLNGRNVYLSGYTSMMLPGRLVAEPSGLGLVMNPGVDYSLYEFEVEHLTVNGLEADDDTREEILSLVKNHISRQLIEKLTAVGLGQVEELVPDYDISRFLLLEPESAFFTIGGLDIHRTNTHAVLNGEFVLR